MKVSVRAFRKLGGTWTAHRNGMGAWFYTGTLGSHSYEVRSYAHFSPMYDGDDDSFTVLWHTTRDGQAWGYATRYPVEQLAQELGKG